MPPNARFIIMSGPAASGKSTIEKRLSSALNLPHLSKDTIKSAIRENIGANIVPARQIGDAAVAALLMVAGEMIQGAIIDNVWRRNQADGLQNIHGHIIELFCSCEMAELERRYALRIRPSNYVPEHANKGDLWSEETMRPVGDFPLIIVNTEKPIDFYSLIKEINDLWMLCHLNTIN